jgi:hypothetical protein
MKQLLLAAAAALALAACGEEPQLLEAAGAPGFRTDAWDDQLRERTLAQNEAGRIQY